MSEKIIIYQILPRLFGNEQSNNTINGSIEENGAGKLQAFTPKVLRAIKEMGFTHIWYTGLLEHATRTDYSKYGIQKDHPAVVKGNAGSPYAIKDYYDIDPDLAGNVPERMSEFEVLVERTHEAGLKMIIDFVPNHVARQYHSDGKPEGVADLGEKDDCSKHFDRDNHFYYFPEQPFSPDFELTVDGNAYCEYPAKATGNDCFSIRPGRNDWYETIKLNYGIDYLNGNHRHFDPLPDTWKHMHAILQFWASKKIDGFRCDMAEMVPVEFWEWLIPKLKQDFPDIRFIAEVYDPGKYRDYLWRGRFDYLYNKVGLYDTLRAIVCGNQPAQAITSCWQATDDIHSQMLNFLENHDEQRIASSFFIGDAWKALPALVVSAFMYKNPLMIYAGQELGEKGMDVEGFSGLDGRTTIFDYWSVDSLRNWYNRGKANTDLLTADQKALRDFYIRILTLCNSSPAIREGKFFDLMYVNPPSDYFNPNKQYAFMRCSGKDLLLIIVNFDDKEVNVRVFLPEHAFSYFKIEEMKIQSAQNLLTGESMPVEFKPNSYYSFNLEKSNVKILKFI